jgi:HPt (histidine-containing phosphotransfer) domain-containing protein
MTMDDAIDENTFAELRGAMGAEFTVELVDTFLQEAPGLLSALRTARAEGDADTYRRAAHSLKSNGNTFGALAFAGLAKDIEVGGLAADPAVDAAALDALEQAYDAAAARLSELCRD